MFVLFFRTMHLQLDTAHRIQSASVSRYTWKSIFWIKHIFCALLMLPNLWHRRRVLALFGSNSADSHTRDQPTSSRPRPRLTKDSQRSLETSSAAGKLIFWRYISYRQCWVCLKTCISSVQSATDSSKQSLTGIRWGILFPSEFRRTVGRIESPIFPILRDFCSSRRGCYQCSIQKMLIYKHASIESIGWGVKWVPPTWCFCGSIDLVPRDSSEWGGHEKQSVKCRERHAVGSNQVQRGSDTQQPSGVLLRDFAQ